MKAATIILDDAECVAILTDEGLLNALQPVEQSRCKAIPFTREGCSCLAIHFFGFPDEKENGYSVTMIPASNDDERKEAAKFFASIIERELNYGEPIAFFEIPPVSQN